MKLIIDIPNKIYNALTHTEFDANLVVDEMRKSIIHGTPIPDNATPCDFCRYNPPSSTDGKPCCMCPATPYQKGGKE